MCGFFRLFIYLLMSCSSSSSSSSSCSDISLIFLVFCSCHFLHHQISGNIYLQPHPHKVQSAEKNDLLGVLFQVWRLFSGRSSGSLCECRNPMILIASLVVWGEHPVEEFKLSHSPQQILLITNPTQVTCRNFVWEYFDLEL